MTCVAAIQMASGPSVSANLLETERLLNEAVDQGAQLIVLPENFALMGMTEEDKLECCETEGSGPIQEFISRQAARHGVWIVAGTIPFATSDKHKIRAVCLLFDDSGNRVDRYDKIHLFDVSLEQSNENYMESETIEAGDTIVVEDTPFGKLGLSVCYDLRFPELYRKMLDYGVEIIVIPSAFTAVTGKAHWEPLLRARAIENLCYVIAANQGGFHMNGRETFGHSMIIDPWGVVLNQLPTGAGAVCANIDSEQLIKMRQNFPCIEHRKISL